MIGIVLNALSTITLYFWYHPPSTGKRLEGQTKWQALKALDWTGLFLLNVGVILFLVSLSLGGATYPWGHPGVIAPLVISIVLFILFAIWEAKLAKNPFFEKGLFQGQSRLFSLFLLMSFFLGGVGAAVAFWAQAVRGIWNGDPIKVGILCIPGGIGAARKSPPISAPNPKKDLRLTTTESWRLRSRNADRKIQTLPHKTLSRLRHRSKNNLRLHDLSSRALRLLWYTMGPRIQFYVHGWEWIHHRFPTCERTTFLSGQGPGSCYTPTEYRCFHWQCDSGHGIQHDY